MDPSLVDVLKRAKAIVENGPSTIVPKPNESVKSSVVGAYIGALLSIQDENDLVQYFLDRAGDISFHQSVKAMLSKVGYADQATVIDYLMTLVDRIADLETKEVLVTLSGKLH